MRKTKSKRLAYLFHFYVEINPTSRKQCAMRPKAPLQTAQTRIKTGVIVTKEV
jgi:hypothetical protein